MTFRIHVVVGRLDTLRPEPLPTEELAALIGPQVVLANSDWLEGAPNGGGHDALLADARFASIMARALVRDFGAQSEPLLMFKGLLEDGLSGWDGLLVDLARSIGDAGADPAFIVHGLSLLGDAPLSVDDVTSRMLDLGLVAKTGGNVAPPEGTAIDTVLRRNRMIKDLIAAVADIARQRALCVTASSEKRLLDWLSRQERAGYTLDHTAEQRAVEALARHFLDGEANAAAGAR